MCKAKFSNAYKIWLFVKEIVLFLFAVILWKFTDWVVQLGDVHKAFELTY